MIVGVEDEEGEEGLLPWKHGGDFSLELLHIGGSVSVLLGEAKKEAGQRVVGVKQLEIVFGRNGELGVSHALRNAHIV